MIKASLKGMLGRKLRTGLTAFSVVLGVAMISGAYIVTDTMLGAADDLSAASYSGVDAVVSGKQAFDVDTNQGFSEPPPLDETVLETVRSVPEVGVAGGEITDDAKLIDRKGEVIGQDGAPSFAVGFDASTPEVRALSPFEFEDGGFPAAPDEVAIDSGTAEREGFEVGDEIAVATEGPVQRFRITGIAGFGSVESIGNATAAVFQLERAQQLFRKEGKLDSILVNAADGVGTSELTGALDRALPPTVEVGSAEAQDRFALGGLTEALDILQQVLVAFGGIALFVGAFIIFNTLSITVAQRAREFALLRTVGASRRQILGSVVLEAAVIGTVASVIGLFAGLGLAAGLNALFVAVGIDLPSSGTVFATRTVIVALAVGIGVTTLAGLAPALRATRVEPVAALREGAIPHGRASRAAPYLAVLTTVLGLIPLAWGVFAADLDVTERLVFIGVGCVVLFIGVALVSPRLVRPLASVLGRPAQRLAGPAGRLARENSMRNPGRTAVTAAALMIGLALVTFVAVLGEGLRSSFGESLEEQVEADYIVTAQDGFSPFSGEAAEALRGAPGVSLVTGVREDQVLAFGDEENVNAVDPATFDAAYNFQWKEGAEAELAQLGDDGAVITDSFADDHGLTVGERFQATAPNGDRLDLEVKGIDERPSFNPLGLADMTISERRFEESFETRKPRFLFVSSSGDPTEAGAEALRKRLEAYPDALLQTEGGYREDSEKDLDQFLGLLYVLLALSVIVSLFGIVNTLVLAVFERTRELGMLRAVGMTRRQVRRMVRQESIIVALIGAVLGMVLGLFLAVLITAALASEGIAFAMPIGTLIAFLIVAVLAGMAAAILPARRASRLNVLDALQYE